MKALEVLIRLKFNNLSPEYEGEDDDADVATFLKKEEIRDHAINTLKYLMDADSVWVGEADEYEEDDEDEDETSENTGYALIGRMADNYEDRGEDWHELLDLIGAAIDASPNREHIMQLAIDNGILES